MDPMGKFTACTWLLDGIMIIPAACFLIKDSTACLHAQSHFNMGDLSWNKIEPLMCCGLHDMHDLCKFIIYTFGIPFRYSLISHHLPCQARHEAAFSTRCNIPPPTIYASGKLLELEQCWWVVVPLYKKSHERFSRLVFIYARVHWNFGTPLFSFTFGEIKKLKRSFGWKSHKAFRYLCWCGGNPSPKTQYFWGNPKVQKIIWELPGRIGSPNTSRGFQHPFVGNATRVSYTSVHVVEFAMVEQIFLGKFQN